MTNLCWSFDWKTHKSRSPLNGLIIPLNLKRAKKNLKSSHFTQLNVNCTWVMCHKDNEWTLFFEAFERITMLNIKHYKSWHKFQSRTKKSFVLITRLVVLFYVPFRGLLRESEGRKQQLYGFIRTKQTNERFCRRRLLPEKLFFEIRL